MKDICSFFIFIAITALTARYFATIKNKKDSKEKYHSDDDNKSASKPKNKFDYSAYMASKLNNSNELKKKDYSYHESGSHLFRQSPKKTWKTSSSTISKSERYYSCSFTPEQIGKAGESAVSSFLSSYCKSSGAHLFNNVTVRYDDGTTQIDHILLTRKGILVIETKNYSGWLFGSTDGKVWTQFVGSKKTVFQNPRRQNHKHCLAVRSLLHFLPNSFIKNLVVLTGDAVFKTEPPNGVIHLCKLEQALKLIKFGQVSDEDLQRAIGVIEYSRLERSKQTDKEHIEYLNRTFGNSPIHRNREYFRRKKYFRNRSCQ